MNYYTHHLGDYAKDTRHLRLVDHGVYRLLLDAVYATERPLPTDFDAVCRICGAVSRTEKDSVKRILDEFFPVIGEHRVNKRAFEEIDAFREKSGKARDSILSRWNRVRNTDVLPPNNEPPPSVIQRARASIPQSPITSNQSPVATSHPPAGGGGNDGFAHVPTDAEVFAKAAAFPGEPASGAPGPMRADWVAEQLRGFHGRNQFPIHWWRLLVAAWRADFRRYTQSGPGEGKKNGAANSGRSPAQHRFLLDKRAEALREERDALHATGNDYREVAARLQAVEAEIEQLTEAVA